MYLSLSPPAPSSFSFRLFVSPLSSSFSSRRPIVADGESSCVRLERKKFWRKKGREIGILLPSASYFTGEERETDTAALDPQQEPRKKRICSDFSLRLSSSNRSLEWKA